jgi:tryptophan synthase alpha chain
MGVTGVRSKLNTDLSTILDNIRAATDVPIAVGFGISTPEQASQISAYADGIIVGSAIVKIIEEHGVNATKYLYEYVRAMKEAVV